MKIKCENVIVCGNYNCVWNDASRCNQDVVALDANGKCILEKSKDETRKKDFAHKE